MHILLDLLFIIALSCMVVPLILIHLWIGITFGIGVVLMITTFFLLGKLTEKK